MKTKSILVVAAALFMANSVNAAHYEVIDLGTVSPFNTEITISRANSINNNGQIVGWSDGYATLFDSTGNGNNVYLGSFSNSDSACWSYAYSINNNGQIVGQAQGGYFAALFDPTGNKNNINLGGREAHSINDNGQIVGFDGYFIAVIFDPTGKKNNLQLGTLGGDSSSALANNNNGDIVGLAMDSSGNSHATLFDSTGGQNNIDLGTLGGNYSRACSINDNGQIVGGAFDSLAGSERATLFDATGSGNNINLGTLGGTYSCAWSINNNGQIVGTAYDTAGMERAVLFDATGGGANINLNTRIDPTSGWVLKEALSINDNGWIVGQGINPDGYERAFLLTPEPATLLLLGLGAVMARRKRA
jgi:probable HAF family extracellular repeat protein